MTRDQIRKLIAEHEVRLLRSVYVGPDGIVRGKAVTPTQLDVTLASGLGLTSAQASVTVFDALPASSEFQPIGEVRIVPDPETLCILPYLPRHARFLSDLITLDGQPWELCPRGLLRTVLQSLEQRGFTLRAAFENEFTLHDRSDVSRRDDARRDDAWTPFSEHNCFASSALDQASPFLLEAVDALEAQGIQVEKVFAEAGRGQLEIPIAHQPGLRAADQQVIFRETIRGVAQARGQRVSFMPKAYSNSAGNGCHIHFSLWDRDGRNAFYDPAAEYQLSAIGRRFAAGLLAHINGVLAFSASTVNSYRRFVERCWSSCYTCWGPDNREATIRVASPFSHDIEGTLNLEYKPADPACNPYLTLSALIIAGVDGIERQLELGPPMLTDPALLSAEERQQRGVEPYPNGLAAALAALEHDELLVQSMGSRRVRDYVTLKRAEIQAIASLGPNGERRAYEFRF